MRASNGADGRQCTGQCRERFGCYVLRNRRSAEFCSAHCSRVDMVHLDIVRLRDLTRGVRSPQKRGVSNGPMTAKVSFLVGYGNAQNILRTLISILLFNIGLSGGHTTYR